MKHYINLISGKELPSHYLVVWPARQALTLVLSMAWVIFLLVSSMLNRCCKGVAQGRNPLLEAEEILPCSQRAGLSQHGNAHNDFQEQEGHSWQVIVCMSPAVQEEV